VRASASHLRRKYQYEPRPRPIGTAPEIKWQDGHWSRGIGVPGIYRRGAGSGGGDSDIRAGEKNEEDGESLETNDQHRRTGFGGEPLALL
jgi:hypothetical protein